jgi:uncharacterized membrane protein
MRSNRTLKLIPFLLAVVAFLGVLDATYLSASELRGVSLLCGEFGDCAEVTSSEYSRVLGVPVAYLGFLFYTTFFLLSLTIAIFKTPRVVIPLFLLSIIGVSASAWFVFVQLVLLKSICIYCMFSALTSTALFLLALYLLKNQKKILSLSPTDSMESEQA